MKHRIQSRQGFISLFLFVIMALSAACSSQNLAPTASPNSVLPPPTGGSTGSVKGTTPAPAQTPETKNTATKLNGQLPQGGDVSDKFQVTSNGKYAVYIADASVNDINELYSVPLSGGQQVKLNGPLDKRQAVDRFILSPDGKYVAYVVKAASADVAIYSVPVAGGTPVLLTLPLKDRSIREYRFSPDSSRVLYSTSFKQDTGDGIKLFSVQVTGGTPVRLSNADTEENSYYVEPDFKVSPDSKRVVFREGLNMFSAPLGGGSITRLNEDEQTVEGFKISANSNSVLYKVHDWETSINYLYTVPIVGGTRTNMTPDLTGGGVYDHVRDSFTFSPDNRWIVFIAQQKDNDYRRELYSVPVDAPGKLTKLNHPIEDPRNIYTFTISMDSKYVVYESHDEPLEFSDLHSVPIGGGKAVRLNVVPSENHPRLISDFTISSDSKRVVIRCSCEDDLYSIYSAPITGPESATVKLNTPPVVDPSDILNYGISPDNQHVLYVEYPYIPYAGYYTYRPLWIMSAPIGGGNAVFIGGPKASSYVFSPDGKYVIFRSSHDTPKGSVDQYNLYISLLAGKR